MQVGSLRYMEWVYRIGMEWEEEERGKGTLIGWGDEWMYMAT